MWINRQVEGKIYGTFQECCTPGDIYLKIVVFLLSSFPSCVSRVFGGRGAVISKKKERKKRKGIRASHCQEPRRR